MKRKRTNVKTSEEEEKRKAVLLARSALQKGVEALSVANVELVCRDTHIKTLMTFLEHESLKTLQIFGMPGTGKTATVSAALHRIAERAREKHVAPPTAVFINGYVVQKASDIYWTLNSHLTEARLGYKENCPADQCAANLEQRFNHGWPASSTLATCVIVMDEIDKIVEQHAMAIYNVVNWLTLPYAACKIITISNSMEVAMDAKLRSRLDKTERLVFPSYGAQELKQILLSRISHIQPRLMSEQAIDLVCHQTASHFGDVRRLLQSTSSAVCGALVRIEEHGVDAAGFSKGIITIRDMHRVVRHVFHDRLVEFVKAIDSPVVFLALSTVALHTKEAARRNDTTVPLEYIYAQVRNRLREERKWGVAFEDTNALLSFAAFLDVVDQLRQVNLIDLSMGDDRSPVGSAISLLDIPEQPYIAMLHPSEEIYDMCRLHEQYGALLSSRSAPP